MEDPEGLSTAYSGKTIAKNTIYNLLGYGVPTLFAVAFIPVLIRGLGTERFGILNLAWIVIGYFSFFDFGIGKGLTKIIAEKIGTKQTEKIPGIFWTSLILMLTASLFAVLMLIFFIPSLVNIFNISEQMHRETLNTFYILAFSIPIVSTTAGLRGVLEAYQKFGIVNIMRVILGIFTFLGPLLVLILTDSLFWIMVFLIFIRLVVWVLYLLECFKVNIKIKSEIKFDFKLIKDVLKFSAWVTLANIVGPMIYYSDRFLIGALISAATITYYATPYEIVTKLLLIPGALTGVLFPAFSASFFANPDISKKILLRGVKFIFLILYPAVFLIVTFSFEGMELWLGKDFATNSSLVLQLLSIGILMNCLSSIPDNFFQGIGKPKIPTLMILTELPFYILAMWFSIKSGGIKGAAFTFMIAAIINASIMYIIANRLFYIKFESRLNAFSFLVMMVGLLFPFLLTSIYLKIIFSSTFLAVFIIIAWKYFLSSEEKFFMSSKLKIKFH